MFNINVVSEQNGSKVSAVFICQDFSGAMLRSGERLDLARAMAPL